MMAWLREVRVALVTGLTGMLARPRHGLLLASGFVIAGITLAVLLTIPAGLARLAGRTGSNEVAVVLPGGATTDTGGSFATARTGDVASLPGIARDARGRPLVVPQFVVNARLWRTDGGTATVLVRGATPAIWAIVGDTFTLHSGRRFLPGRQELISGVAARRGFEGLDDGAILPLHKTPWRVTGGFAAGGGFWESELWTDLAPLQSTFHAQGTLTCLWVKLESPAAFDVFRKALHDDPRTQGLQAIRQSDYYAGQTGFLAMYIGYAMQGIALILGLGAIMAIINALGLALDARSRELATLRALGFRRGTLSLALLLEVLAIGAACAVVVLLAAWLGIDGREVGSSTSTSAILFRLHVDRHVIMGTLGYLLILGGIGSLWPILRAVRAPLTRALQSE